MTDRLPPKYELDEWTLYAISDGLYRLDGGAMFGTVPKVLWEKVKPPDERNRLDMCLTCLLVVKGDMKVLIEAGIGGKNPAKFRDIYGVDRITSIDNELEKIGLTALDINHVVLSHLHFDHAGSLTEFDERGEPVLHFPNAIHHLHILEWEAALHPHARTRASYLQGDWLPVVEADLVELHEKDVFEICPGISGRLVGGHTPGLSIVEITGSSGEKAVFAGDLIPTAAHMPIPWVMGYDLDPTTMVKTKEELLSVWESQHTLVVFPHETRCPWAFVIKDEKGNFKADCVDSGWLEPLRRVQWPTLPVIERY